MLVLDELDKHPFQYCLGASDAVKVENGTFSWGGGDNKPALKQ